MTYELIPQDLLDLPGEAVESGGAIDLTFGPVPVGHVWEVNRIVISTTSSTDTVARVYNGAAVVANLRSGSAVGNFDEGEYDPPLRFQAGEIVRIRWTATPSAGSRGNARLEGMVSRISRGKTPTSPRPAGNVGGW